MTVFEKMTIAVAMYLGYLGNFDFLALPLKKGNFTIYAIFDSTSARALVDEKVLKKLWRLDGTNLRWRAPMINKVPWQDMPKPLTQLTIAHRWNEFEVIAGNMARAQELAVCTALNQKHFLGEQWLIGSGRLIEGEYNPDIYSARYKVEVKGIDSPITEHYNSNH